MATASMIAETGEPDTDAVAWVEAAMVKASRAQLEAKAGNAGEAA